MQTGPRARVALMSMSVKRQIRDPAEEKTIGKFKQVYSEEFKLDKVILQVHVWACVCVLLCFLLPFLGHQLAQRNWGPLSVPCHEHASLLAHFRKHIFGIGAKLLPLFTLYLPVLCCFVTHVSV